MKNWFYCFNTIIFVEIHEKWEGAICGTILPLISRPFSIKNGCFSPKKGANVVPKVSPSDFYDNAFQMVALTAKSKFHNDKHKDLQSISN